ncbi:hypothetical protein [uncultured Ruegeria sp.]|jgi:hypothetical protein|uniref:hypothetical protein n=1 Tax=uncultured Ruegeria sp. TaxID=259304 RepID=UPI0026380626|nr:hypothetical protein [uncultured Ruegeria sp.]
MILYSHRLQGVLQQMVVELGLDLILSDDNSAVSLIDNEQMLTEVAAGVNVEVKKLAANNGAVLFRFQRKS